MKKLLNICLLLAVIVAVSIFARPLEVEAAANGTCGENLTWTLDDEGTLTISGTGAMYDYSPGTLGQSPWLEQSTPIKAVVIEDGVTSIGPYAFFSCNGLTTVTIPASVKSIGDYAFALSDLTELTIPDGVISIGYNAFSDCRAMTKLTLSDSVESIGTDAFSFCMALTEVIIPRNAQLGQWAFRCCHNLVAVLFEEGATSTGSGTFAGCIDLSVVFFPDSITFVDAYAFENCTSLVAFVYCGTEEQWREVEIRGVDPLVDVSLALHAYDDDFVCAICGDVKDLNGWIVGNDGNWYYYKDRIKATGWLQDGNTWYYLGTDGVMVTGIVTIDGVKHEFASNGAWLGEAKEEARNGWLQVDGKWYYYKDNVMATGWLQDNGTWYYLDADGVMVTGIVTIGVVKHEFNSSGAWLGEVKGQAKNGWFFEVYTGNWFYYKDDVKVTGWLEDGGERYYLRDNGAMATGIVTIDGVKHKFASSGAWLGEVKEEVKNGWIYDGGKWYYYKNNVMVTGWLQLGSTWYYMETDGVMVTGWLLDGSTWYYLDTNGAMVTGWIYDGGKWYYLNTSGAMVTGWLWDVNTWYYFYGNGVMATNINISGGWIDGSGVWHG